MSHWRWFGRIDPLTAKLAARQRPPHLKPTPPDISAAAVATERSLFDAYHSRDYPKAVNLLYSSRTHDPGRLVVGLQDLLQRHPELTDAKAVDLKPALWSTDGSIMVNFMLTNSTGRKHYGYSVMRQIDGRYWIFSTQVHSEPPSF